MKVAKKNIDAKHRAKERRAEKGGVGKEGVRGCALEGLIRKGPGSWDKAEKTFEDKNEVQRDPLSKHGCKRRM